MSAISIVIPVGPKPYHRTWLKEAIQSVESQMNADDEIVLVNDGGEPIDTSAYTHPISTFSFPTNIGCVGAWNTGVAVARNEYILFLGADDKLLPWCLEGLRTAQVRDPDLLTWHYLAVQYEDGKTQNVPCQAAMVTKTLWRYTGGFPLECALGAIDHIFLQMLMTGGERKVSKARIVGVSDTPLYWYRVHPLTETNTRTQRWWGIIDRTLRNELAQNWIPNADYQSI